MCHDWELQFKIDFRSARWTTEIIKDQSKKDTYKKRSASDFATAASILAEYHSNNNGDPMNKRQFLDMLHMKGVSKDKGSDLLTAGVTHKPAPIWTVTTGNKNAVLFNLVGWTKDDEI
jgi:hypothetical protein